VTRRGGRAQGCRGCLGLLIILALLAWPTVVLVEYGGSDATGALFLSAGALLLGASRQGRAGRRHAPERESVGIPHQALLPRVTGLTGGGHRATARVQSGDRTAPVHEDRRAHDFLTKGRAAGDTGTSGSRPATSAGISVRRARDPLPARLRFAILQRDAFRCRYCGRLGSAPGVVLHVDHVVPLAGGGATTADNLVTACEECNLGKATRAVVKLES
jgi:hypothetical protein